MPVFGAHSLAQLATLHPNLQRVLKEAITVYDFKITEGFRGKEAQNYAYDHGFSNVRYPFGNHNKRPSLAADCYPFPIPPNFATNKLYHVKQRQFAHLLLGVGAGLGIGLRWGGDWNQNWIFTDQRLHDLPHIELT